MFHYLIRKSTLILVLFYLNLRLLDASDVINPTQPRQCYICEGINCQRTTKLNATTTCTDLLDICVTVFNDFAVVAKGCLLDMSEVYRRKCNERNNPECFKCFGEKCNNVGRKDFKCLQCDSNDDKKCDADTSEVISQQCSIPTAPNSYCFVRSYGSNNIQRGCLVHLQEQLDCIKDSSCSMCLSDDAEACNSYKLNSSPVSGASETSVYTTSIFLILMICRIFI